jgi:NAD+ diphosphatase
MTEPNFYAGGDLDRIEHWRKDPAWLKMRLADPTSLFVPVWRNQSLVIGAGEANPRALFLGPHQLAVQDGEAVLLGVREERAYFAIDLSGHDAPLEALSVETAAEFIELRRVGPLLPRAEGSLLAYARGMAYWHTRQRFCGTCGSPTVSEEGGHQRRCTVAACNTLHFPRTDPAVIMLVHDGDRCLLGRQRRWANGMYSTLAGFVEPGESLEEAVAREVFEETAIVVDAVTYHSSQPWPFPASLMLGFHARARTTEIRVDGRELEGACWFERDYLLKHRDDDSFRLPRRDSIARRLIEDWLRR